MVKVGLNLHDKGEISKSTNEGFDSQRVKKCRNEVKKYSDKAISREKVEKQVSIEW